MNGFYCTPQYVFTIFFICSDLSARMPALTSTIMRLYLSQYSNKTTKNK